MIVQSTLIWANYLSPNSPYCIIYLWWETERENWSWSLLGVKGLRNLENKIAVSISSLYADPLSFSHWWINEQMNEWNGWMNEWLYFTRVTLNSISANNLLSLRIERVHKQANFRGNDQFTDQEGFLLLSAFDEPNIQVKTAWV